MNKKIMKKVKSKWVVATVFTAMAGISAFAPMEASAAEWNARTPQQIEITDRSHYDIVWGDTLWAISEASNVSIEALVEINHIANRDLILAGNYLVIEGNVVSITQQNDQTDSFKVEGNTVTPVETPAKPVVSHEKTTSKNETVVETPKVSTTQVPVFTPEVKPEEDNGESGNFAPDVETSDVDVPVTPALEEVPMTPIEPSTPVTPEAKPEEKPEVPMTPIGPSYPVQSLYEELSFYFMDTGYYFEVVDDGAGAIQIGYNSGVGSQNQNDIDNYDAIRLDAINKVQSMGLSHEIIDGNDWFVINVNY